MSSFQNLCHKLGIPLNEEKTEGPATVIKFLGLTIDTQAQTISIPPEKIVDLLSILETLLEKETSNTERVSHSQGNLTL